MESISLNLQGVNQNPSLKFLKNKKHENKELNFTSGNQFNTDAVALNNALKAKYVIHNKVSFQSKHAEKDTNVRNDDRDAVYSFDENLTKRDIKALNRLIKREEARQRNALIKFFAALSAIFVAGGAITPVAKEAWNATEPYYSALVADDTCKNENWQNLPTIVKEGPSQFAVKVPDSLRDKLKSDPLTANEISNGQICIKNSEVKRLKTELELLNKAEMYITFSDSQLKNFNKIIGGEYGTIRSIDPKTGLTSTLIGKLNKEVNIGNVNLPKDKWFIVKYDITYDQNNKAVKRAANISYITERKDLSPEKLAQLESNMPEGQKVGGYIENYRQNISKWIQAKQEGKEIDIDLVLNNSRELKTDIISISENFGKSPTIVTQTPNEFWNDILKINNREMSLMNKLASISKNNLNPNIKIVTDLTGIDGFFFVKNKANPNTSNMIIIKLTDNSSLGRYVAIRTEKSFSVEEQNAFDIREIPNSKPNAINIIGNDGSFIELSNESALSTLKSYNPACGDPALYNNAPSLINEIVKKVSNNTCYDPFDVAYQFKKSISDMTEEAYNSNAGNIGILGSNNVFENTEMPHIGESKILTPTESKRLSDIFINKASVTIKNTNGQNLLTLTKTTDSSDGINSYYFKLQNIDGTDEVKSGEIKKDGTLIFTNELIKNNGINKEEETLNNNVDYNTLRRRIKMLIEKVNNGNESEISFIPNN